MARAAKGSAIDEKIIEIDREIESYKKAITELAKSKKALLNAKKNEEKEELKRIAAESGLTASELRELIEKHKKAK